MVIEFTLASYPPISRHSNQVFERKFSIRFDNCCFVTRIDATPDPAHNEPISSIECIVVVVWANDQWDQSVISDHCQTTAFQFEIGSNEGLNQWQRECLFVLLVLFVPLLKSCALFSIKNLYDLLSVEWALKRAILSAEYNRFGWLLWG